MVYLGWPAGVTIMILSWVATLYTLWQMCSLHQVQGRRFNRYHELGQYAMGKPSLLLAHHIFADVHDPFAVDITMCSA